MDLYQVVRSILFSTLKADPEWLHQRVIQILGWIDRNRDHPSANLVTQRIDSLCSFRDERLHQTLWGLTFPNPLGLAAGFDKNGEAARVWSALGFGYAELGTVTLYAQPGNPKPRLFRLIEDRAALNRMGFNNQGAAALAERLQGRDTKAPGSGEWGEGALAYPIGINLGKSKITDLEAAADDYLGSFRLLKDLGDYFVVNVSSPNTPGLRSLQATEQLEPILSALQTENEGQKPLLVKIAPDLSWEEIAAILTLAQQYHLAGIIATNTTISREGLKTQVIEATGKSVHDEAGGISGAPLTQRSTEVIRFIYQQTQGTLPIIGVGGIFTAEDAWEKLTAGASLLQTYTGWIYEGPMMPRRICAGLLQKLEESGLESLGKAVGIGKG
ncbi:MAG: quinone-dependent dihydroorotate dehydrogenase [Leptolyngbyaceae cyanobacterium bins.59]|nr:quinone-dependent dihydroorotate dehydrogenase [Leptolyngbyaceae cyanobacterium bins.59]